MHHSRAIEPSNRQVQPAMKDLDQARPAEFLVFIDEAGDPGLRTVRPIDPNGSSEWLVLGAVVLRNRYETSAVQWIKDIRLELEIRQRPDVHYRNLSDTKRLSAARIVATLPIRTFVLLSNKKNMRQHRNISAEKIPTPDWFYNFCIRLLLERISQYLAKCSPADGAAVGPARLIFSRRGSAYYGHINSYMTYLRKQSENGRLFLKAGEVDWTMIDIGNTTIVHHDESAGAQLADIVTSAFYQAADARSSRRWATAPAELLEPIVAHRRKQYAGIGVTLMPAPAWKADLTYEQAKIFQFYGYDFRAR